MDGSGLASLPRKGHGLVIQPFLIAQRSQYEYCYVRHINALWGVCLRIHNILYGMIFHTKP